MANIARLSCRETVKRIWCPGCGNGIILGATVRAIHKAHVDPDRVAFLSGVGCAGRASNYMDFDAMHTLHGRTLPPAIGIKLARPDLKVIIFTGDGDAVAIGGNHFIHAARRNIDLTMVIANNMIYGMTGGQVAPTTEIGDLASTAPYGNIEPPFDICRLAESAGATYVARSTAYHAVQTIRFIERAILHKGFSVVEVMSQCPTQYGHLNRIGNAVEMLKWLKERAVPMERAREFSAEEMREKIVMGEFVNKERPEYSEEYARLIEKARNHEKQRNL
jgi:2-oxoglutarate ferredoxin oxidoreductase subunit beta